MPGDDFHDKPVLVANLMTMLMLKRQGIRLDRDVIFLAESGEEADPEGVGINFINRVHQFANLGYWVRTSAAGRGVATRATKLAARFGFAELGLNRIEIVAAVDNIASQRVAERAGAVREGILRHRLSINGVPHNAVLFSLVAGDLNAS